MTNHTTSETTGQTHDFKPQTYEEWKTAHGWQPEAEPRLEIGQRVKAAHDQSEDDEWVVEWDGDEPPITVPEGTPGVITALHPRQDWMYEVQFDNGVKWYCYWSADSELDDGWEGGAEIKPVGKSPSQLAYEQSERERLAAYQQLSLFDAAQTGGAS